MTRSVWARQIGQRALWAVLVLWGTATVTFLAQAALPGDRATAILNVRTGNAEARTPVELASVVSEYGLDRPLVVQYLDHLGGLLRGDLGVSYQQHRPVAAIIAE